MFSRNSNQNKYVFFVVLRLAGDLNVNLSAMYLLQFAITGLTICGSEFRLTNVRRTARKT